MITESRWRLSQLLGFIIVNIVIVVAAYGKQDTRISVAEQRIDTQTQRIDEEIKGYRILLGSFGEEFANIRKDLQAIKEQNNVKPRR